MEDAPPVDAAVAEVMPEGAAPDDGAGEAAPSDPAGVELVVSDEPAPPGNPAGEPAAATAETSGDGAAAAEGAGAEEGGEPGAPPPDDADAAPARAAGEEGAREPAAADGEAADDVDGEAADPTEEGGDGEGGDGEGGDAAADGEAEGVPAGEDGGEEDGGEAAADPAEATDAPPAAPPPYVPPEVGDDYVPVAQLPPLPTPYGTAEDGKVVPLPGVESVFLTGTTVELVGLSHLGAGAGKEGHLVDYIAKDKILGDIQFRGAISDFYVIKQKIIDADYDPLLVKINEDDVYGDGNNWQIVLADAAAKTWAYIEDEAMRRKQLAVDELLREKIEKSKPRSQKKRIIKQWVGQGSELEIEEGIVAERRARVTVVVQKRRRDFNGSSVTLYDKDASELWNSAQMECRPFKDPNFDLRRMLNCVSVQAVPPVVDVGVQAAAERPRPNAAQTSPLDLTAEQKAEEIKSRGMRKFLERVMVATEEALIQNEVTNIFEDDFSALVEDDAAGGGNRKEAAISEFQSFTHLTYSKNKVVSCIQWLPHRKGVVAVACTEALSHQERVSRMGRPQFAYILIWNFRDPINPECVLQAPYEVFTFQFNPENPDIIAAGCYNGQVVLWDMSAEHERIAAIKASSAKDDHHGGSSDPSAASGGAAGGAGGAGGSGAAGDAEPIPIVKWRYASAIEFSHQHVVTDLSWLPGVDATRGRFVALPTDDGKQCHFLATTGGDGKVNFWDIRMEKLFKKGRNKGGEEDLVWKPTHSVHMVSLLGMDLGGTCFCFNPKQLEKGAFCIGSFDGELVNGNYLKPDSSGENESSDCTKSIVQAHVGPIVALQRSPFLDDILLSVGDWSFQVWREGDATPLFSSAYAADYYTAGCWSPTRPAVIYLTDQAGNLEVWDVLDRLHEPSMRATLSSSPFMSLGFMGGDKGTSQAQFLALGDSAGVLRIVELPRNLRRAVPNESKLMMNFLEREGKRVADVAERAPLRAKVAKAADDAKKAVEEAAAKAAADGKDAGGTKDQTFLTNGHALIDAKAEEEYYKLEHAFKVKLGLVGGAGGGENRGA
ncbi:hypothetical protein FOA52_010956 [Chlamydomonas sp. UWO 241]|nr:hypothetical protein FOA52_010956 [Chlamydomonas sp. UWO 241]